VAFAARRAGWRAPSAVGLIFAAAIATLLAYIGNAVLLVLALVEVWNSHYEQAPLHPPSIPLNDLPEHSDPLRDNEDRCKAQGRHQRNC